jgi:hypothetical protein
MRHLWGAAAAAELASVHSIVHSGATHAQIAVAAAAAARTTTSTGGILQVPAVVVVLLAAPALRLLLAAVGVYCRVSC